MTKKKIIKLTVLKKKKTPSILGLKMGAIDPDTGEIFATESFSLPWGMVATGEHLEALRRWAINIYAKQVLKQGRIPEKDIPKLGDNFDFNVDQKDIDKHMKRTGLIKDE